MTKIKKYCCEGWIVIDVIIKHSINIFDCQYTENKYHKNNEDKE